MEDEAFSHVNELLALAPLGSPGDEQLFSKQTVSLNGAGKVQWDFILCSGLDYHFTELAENLRTSCHLRAFKDLIRARLSEQSSR